MKVNFVRMHKDAKTPTYGKPGDAAMDLSSYEAYTLEPGKTYTFETGIKMEIPEGYFGRIMDRSGLAAKHGLHVLAGVIDASYRGEIKICLLNTSDKAYSVEKGERIAQMAIIPILSVSFNEVTDLSDTERGEGGFGHTGNS